MLQITLAVCFVLMFGNSMLLTSFYASSLVSIWVSRNSREQYILHHRMFNAVGHSRLVQFDQCIQLVILYIRLSKQHCRGTLKCKTTNNNVCWWLGLLLLCFGHFFPGNHRIEGSICSTLQTWHRHVGMLKWFSVLCLEGYTSFCLFVMEEIPRWSYKAVSFIFK